MNYRNTSFICLLLLLLTVTAGAQNASKKKSSLGEPIFPSLEYVNLNAELELQSEMLRGFGSRVDDARRDADAEALAAQAVLLAFAEEIAAKKASSVTAKLILEEALRIATEQQNRDAARVIVSAANKIPGGEEISASMKDSMSMFASMRGEGNFVAYIKILNDVDRALDVYVDGKYVGSLYGGESGVYSTGNGSTQTRVMDAFGNTVNELFFLQQESTIEWEITP
jgi:hypothetical protein